ncbi:MAG: SDR family oxidoreductase [Streptosporangiaceae bacterium]
MAGTSRDTSRVTPLDGVTLLDLDVASDASVTAAVQQVIERFGRIDVLVSNSGMGAIGAVEESSLAQAQEVYADQRRAFDRMMETAIKDGDDPAIVAKVIVAAATGPKPKLRYTAGFMAWRASTLRRFAPAGVFDKQIRKINRLAG